jgi:hypothetical protein
MFTEVWLFAKGIVWALQHLTFSAFSLLIGLYFLKNYAPETYSLLKERLLAFLVRFKVIVFAEPNPLHPFPFAIRKSPAVRQWLHECRLCINSAC